MFGFARTEPLTYFQRTGKLPDQPSESISWSPWKKIGITINAERVQPVCKRGSKSWDVDDIEQAQLYVTNPSRSSEYDPSAYIYVFVAIEGMSDELVGRLTAAQTKTVSASFPAVVGPYENFNATLTQLSHRTVLRPEIDGVKYLLTAEGDVPVSIRSDWRPNQQVALSRGINDSGLFQLNYQDERYLPFEGTGAVSRWRLQINGVDGAAHREHLRDVILTLQYTALPGGDDFAEKVKSALPPVDKARMLNLAYDFPEQWQAFVLNPSRGLTFKLEKSHLPWAKPATVSGLYLHYDLTESGAGAIGRQAVRLNGEMELSPGSLRGGLKLPLGEWKLVPTGRADRFTAENIKSMMLIVTYSAKPVF